MSESKEKLSSQAPALSVLFASENRSWCPVPWASCSTTTSGQYRLCVQANTDRLSRGLFSHDDSAPMMALDTPVSKARNGGLAKEVRLAMLNNLQHSACVRCRQDEDAGIVSRRALARLNYTSFSNKISFNKCVEKTTATGEIDHQDFPILDMDLRLGNRCNLKCRSCSPSESNAWYGEWYDTISKKFNSGSSVVHLTKDDMGRVSDSSQGLDWIGKSIFRTTFFEDCPELDRLAIVGGEPLLISEHFDILKDLVDSKRAQGIILEYNTNLTVLPQKVLDLWQHFKEVKIGYSIDGVWQVNDYIRSGAQFSKIARNLKTLQQAPGNFDIWVTFTLMAFNVLYVSETIQWVIESGLHKKVHPMNRFLVIHALRNPAELSAQVLPEKTKTLAKKKLKDFKEGWFETYVKEHLLDPNEADSWRQRLDIIIQMVSRHLEQEDGSHRLPQFRERVQTMDRYRGEDLRQALPELAQSLSF